MVTFKEFFSFKNNRFFWLNLVAMIIVVIAIALGTLQWLDNYTRHGEAVVVPNVKGLPMRQAENEIYKQSLKAVAIDSSYVKDAARCHIGTESRRRFKSKKRKNGLSHHQYGQCTQSECSRYHGQQFTAPSRSQTACIRLQSHRTGIHQR